MLKIQCPNQACRQTYKIADDRIGSTVKCKKCGHRFTVEFSGSQAVAIPEEDHSSPGQDSAVQHPDRIERFEVQNYIDSGAFGAVYKARDPQLQRDVAIKLLKLNNDPKSDSHKIRRFLQEGRAAARLQHPHIVPVFDAGQDTVSGEYYLAAAFIEGQTLKSFAGQEPLESTRAALMTSQLAQALEYAHRRGVLHRDVKPENVMVDQEGTPYLMDFGIARLDDSEERMTKDGSLLGTPAFMSPEQFVGKHEELTGASDQYSLGCVLYQLLTGRTPFDGNWQSQLHYHLNETPAPPSKHNPTVPRDLETICLKCLSKEAPERYASCGDLSEDLERWLEGEPISARPLNRIQKFARWCRKEPIVASLTAGVFLVFAVGLVTTSWQWSRAEVQKMKAVNARKTAEESISKLKIAQREADVQRQKALGRRNVALKQLYISKMGQAQIAWEENRYEDVKRILRATTPKEEEPDFRGWEWYYLNGVNSSSTHILTTGMNRIPTTNSRYHKETGIHWSPNGEFLMSVLYNGMISQEQYVMVWKTTDLQTIVQVPERAQFASWNRQSSHFATVNDRIVSIWDVQLKGKIASIRAPNLVRSVSWSPSGEVIAGLCGPQNNVIGEAPSKSEVILWNALTGEVVRSLELHKIRLKSSAWSPRSEILTVSFEQLSDQSKVLDSGQLLIDTNDLSIVDKITNISAPYLSEFFWSEDGKTIAAIQPRRVPRPLSFWDQKFRARQIYIAPVGSFSVRPDFQQVASIHKDDCRLAIFDTNTYRKSEIGFFSGSLHSVAMHPDGDRVAVCYVPDSVDSPVIDIRTISSSHSVRQFIPVPCKQRKIRGKHYSYRTMEGPKVTCFERLKSDNLLCYGTEDGRVEVFDTQTGQIIDSIPAFDHAVQWLSYCPRNRLIACYDTVGRLLICTVDSSKLGEVFKSTDLELRSAAWNHSTGNLLCVGVDGTVTMLDAMANARTEIAPQLPSSALAIASGRSTSVASTNDGRVWIWKSSSLDGPHELKLMLDVSVSSLAVDDPNQQYVAGTDNLGNVLIWSVESRKLLHRLLIGSKKRVLLAWQPNNDRLAVSGDDGFVRIYDAESGMQVFRLALDMRYSHATGLKWSADGTELVASVGRAGRSYFDVFGEFCIWRANQLVPTNISD